MLQDKPLYEEMVRRGSGGCRFWLVGNWLVYSGLAGIILLLILWPMVFYFKISEAGLISFLALILMAALFTLGSFLKRISYKIALREGMDILKYIEGQDKGKS